MRRSILAVVAAVMLLAMGGVALGGTVTVKAADGNRFMPKAKSVPTGTKIVWKNTDNVGHTVTSVSKNWSKNSSLSAGASTSFTFKKKGTYRYRCTIHSTVSSGTCSGMCGKVVVG